MVWADDDFSYFDWLNRLSKFWHGVVPDHVSFCGIFFFFLNSELDGLCPRLCCNEHYISLVLLFFWICAMLCGRTIYPSSNQHMWTNWSINLSTIPHNTISQPPADLQSDSTIEHRISYSEQLSLHGIEIDTIRMQIMPFPQDKLVSARLQVDTRCRWKKVSLREVQSLIIGTLILHKTWMSWFMLAAELPGSRISYLHDLYGN